MRCTQINSEVRTRDSLLFKWYSYILVQSSQFTLRKTYIHIFRPWHQATTGESSKRPSVWQGWIMPLKRQEMECPGKRLPRISIFQKECFCTDWGREMLASHMGTPSFPECKRKRWLNFAWSRFNWPMEWHHSRYSSHYVVQALS